jgi:hypothetical protein
VFAQPGFGVDVMCPLVSVAFTSSGPVPTAHSHSEAAGLDAAEQGSYASAGTGSSPAASWPSSPSGRSGSAGQPHDSR